MLGLDPNRKLKLVEQDDVILNSTLTSPITILEKPTEAYVDSLSETKRNRQKRSTLVNDQGDDFDKNNLTKLKGIRVDRNPLLDEELSNETFIDTELNENFILRIFQTLQNYLRVSVETKVVILQTMIENKQKVQQL